MSTHQSTTPTLLTTHGRSLVALLSLPTTHPAGFNPFEVALFYSLPPSSTTPIPTTSLGNIPKEQHSQEQDLAKPESSNNDTATITYYHANGTMFPQ